MVLEEQGGAHHLRHVGLRLAAIHRRMDALEAKLRQRARELGEDSTLSMSELSRRLDARTDRRQAHPDGYWVERRLWARREEDRHLLAQSSVPNQERVPPLAESVRMLLDVFEDVVLVASARWDCLAGNRAAVRLLGYAPDQLLSASLYSLIPAPDVRSSRASNDWAWPRCLSLRCRDGRVARIRARAHAVQLSAGRANLLIGQPL